MSTKKFYTIYFYDFRQYIINQVEIFKDLDNENKITDI